MSDLRFSFLVGLILYVLWEHLIAAMWGRFLLWMVCQAVGMFCAWLLK